MDFFINKDSTLPILKLELIQDGRYDFRRFYDLIQNADIYFTMSNLDTGVKKIGKRLTLPLLADSDDCLGDEYFLAYQFTARDTNTAGIYIGKFIIEFLDGSGTLIVPIRE